jgi:hypothetical protein
MQKIKKLSMAAGYLIFLLLIAVVTTGQESARMPTVSDLLDKYTKALDSTESFIATCEVVGQFSYYIPGFLPRFEGAKRYTRTYHRSDGHRIYEQLYDWGDISPDIRDIPEKNANYNCRIISDKFNYQNSRFLNNPNSRGGASYDLVGTKKATLSRNTSDSSILGFIGSDERLDGVLRESKQISVRPKTENIKNSNCYVIDAQTKYGKYTLWLDSNHGYHPAKVNYKAVEGDEYYDKGKLEKGNSRTLYLDNVRFEKVDDVWVPMEADRGTNNIYGDPGSFAKDDTHFKRTKIILNPDHAKLGSFDDPLKNPKQDPELINGTRFILNGLGNITYTWKDGKIVDDYDHIVEPNNINSSLIGKSLPDLAQFNVKLDFEFIRNKLLLVCFWDLEQRPSRNAIQTLNKRAKTLLEKSDVYITFIHAGPVEEQEFASWLKENEIHSLVGVSRTGLPELGYTWGVQSLPWLILTDKNHIVQAEGFSINELDAKIKTLAEK